MSRDEQQVGAYTRWNMLQLFLKCAVIFKNERNIRNQRAFSKNVFGFAVLL